MADYDMLVQLRKIHDELVKIRWQLEIANRRQQRSWWRGRLGWLRRLWPFRARGEEV